MCDSVPPSDSGGDWEGSEFADEARGENATAVAREVHAAAGHAPEELAEGQPRLKRAHHSPRAARPPRARGRARGEITEDGEDAPPMEHIPSMHEAWCREQGLPEYRERILAMPCELGTMAGPLARGGRGDLLEEKDRIIDAGLTERGPADTAVDVAAFWNTHIRPVLEENERNKPAPKPVPPVEPWQVLDGWRREHNPRYSHTVKIDTFEELLAEMQADGVFFKNADGTRGPIDEARLKSMIQLSDHILKLRMVKPEMMWGYVPPKAYK